jgi:hypothetical protein
MSNELGCEAVRKLAPELSLGISTGEERARALEHLATCSDCRKVVAELSSVADELLLLAPVHEPPAGFETRVLARLSEERRLRWPRRIGALAATAVVAAVVASVAILWLSSDDRQLAGYVRDQLAEANGEYFRVEPLRDPDGIKDGVLFGYEGKPSWMFVDIDGPVKRGEYQAQLVTEDGRSLDWGEPFELSPDKRWWAQSLPVDLHDVAMVRIISTEHGDQVLGARFTSSR